MDNQTKDSNQQLYKSSDIGIKTAVQTNQFVNIKQKSGFQKFLEKIKAPFIKLKERLKNPATRQKTRLAIILSAIISILIIVALVFLFIFLIKQFSPKPAPIAKPGTLIEEQEKITKIIEEGMDNIVDKPIDESLKTVKERIEFLEKSKENKTVVGLRYKVAGDMYGYGLYHEALEFLKGIKDEHLSIMEKYNVYEFIIDTADKAQDFETKNKYENLLKNLPAKPSFGGGGGA